MTSTTEEIMERESRRELARWIARFGQKLDQDDARESYAHFLWDQHVREMIGLRP